MSDLRKCFKLIKYGKMAKFSIIISIFFIAAGIIFTTAKLADAAAGRMDVSAAEKRLWYDMFTPVYFMYFGVALSFSPISAMFYTPHFNSSPLRKYAETKFIPIMFFLESLALIFFIAILGILFSLKGAFAGTAAAAAIIIGPVFYGFIMITSMAFVKYVWLIFLMIPAAFSVYKLANSLCVYIALNFSGISAALIAAGIALVISIASSLLCYAVNLIVYKKSYPKIWTKYQKVT